MFIAAVFELVPVWERGIWESSLDFRRILTLVLGKQNKESIYLQSLGKIKRGRIHRFA